MIHTYMNGNTLVTINDKDGTRQMFTRDDEFRFDYPVSMDINLTQKCDGGCSYCYAECTSNGKHGDIMGAKFIDTLMPYTECALQVNDLSHPDLIPFLKKLKDKKVFANITVNQIHFERSEEFIADLIDQKLVYGLGVSLRSATNDFIEKVQQYPNAVIHMINGVVTLLDFSLLRNHDLKILILGYKDKGRGHEYIAEKSHEVEVNQKNLKWWLKRVINGNEFKAIAFDNLALEQLGIKKIVPKDQWERFYQGDEGTCSMYVDLVDQTFGVSSIVPKTQMLPLMDSVVDMFSKVKEIA